MTPADIPRKYNDVACALPMMPRRRVSVEDNDVVSLPTSGPSLRKGGRSSIEDVGALVDKIVSVQLKDEFLLSNDPAGCATHDDDASVELCDIKPVSRQRSFSGKQARRASRRSTKLDAARLSVGSNSITSLPMLESFCHGSSVGDSLWNSSVEDSMASADFSTDHIDIILEHEKGELIRNLVRIDTSLLEENELCPVARCATMQKTGARWEHPTRGDSMPSLPGACRGSNSR